MKRMYVALGILLLLVFGAGTLIAQQVRPVDDADSAFEKRMKIREEMHRRIMDKLIRGIGPDQGMFADMEKMMDDMMVDSFSGFDSLAPNAENFKMEWSHDPKGRTLSLTPNTKDQQLDINISQGMIIIKGNKEVKTANGVSVSNFTNSFNVPGDCDPAKVKMDQKDGKILVFFPYISAKPVEMKPKEDRRPLPPSDGDVQI